MYDESCPQILNQYLDYVITVKRKSINTAEGYKIDLKMFLKYMKKLKNPTNKKLQKSDVQEVDITIIPESLLRSITLSDLYGFIGYITNERKNGEKAIVRKLSSIKSFFTYLETKVKLIKENPSKELEKIKLEKRNPVYLTLDQTKDLLNSVDGITGRNKERDYAILTVFLNCGVRLSELVSIDIDKIRGNTLTVIGKGNKERVIYMNDAVVEAINNYLKVRNSERVIDPKALFLSEQKKRIAKRTIGELVAKYIKASDLTDNKYTPHKLRHTCATMMYQHGNVDIRALQEILGHESVATTQIYTHTSSKILQNAVDSNPLAEIRRNNNPEQINHQNI